MTETTSAPPLVRARPPLWREALYIGAVYLVYSTVRNQFGSAGDGPEAANRIAYEHALDLIRVEEALGLYIEHGLQSWYLDLPADGWIQFWNVFYGTAHFAVTIGALVWLFLRNPVRYPRMRNTLAVSTLLALIGFASYSLMPPRLLDEPPSRFGPPATATSEPDRPKGYVDTLAEYPTFWSFDSGGLKNISNQYAAMPSLHTAWAVWAAIVLWSLVRRPWAKALVVAHPVATVFCIMVTANHFWLDALGGLAVLGAGWFIGTRVADWWDRRRAPDQSLADADHPDRRDHPPGARPNVGGLSPLSGQ